MKIIKYKKQINKKLLNCKKILSRVIFIEFMNILNYMNCMKCMNLLIEKNLYCENCQ